MEEIRRIREVHQHNTFAELIEEIYGDDFIYDNHWRLNNSLKMKENEYKERISSSKFKEIIFDKNGKLANYLLDHIKKVMISEDYEEIERITEIYNSLFILKKKRILLKENVEKFFYLRDHPFDRSHLRLFKHFQDC